MIDVLKMVITNLLLHLYFLLDNISAVTLREDLYAFMAPLYDRIYSAAVRIAPFDIPPIYEGIDFNAFEYSDTDSES